MPKPQPRRIRRLNLLLVVGLLVVLNLLGTAFFYRFDLTAEGRYSLSPLTRTTLSQLEAPLYVTVYLEGEYPANVRRFQEAVRTTLREMQQYADAPLDFEFIDPSNNTGLMQDLRQRGYPPVPVRVQVSQTETENKLMFPVVVLRHRDREQYIDLLKGAAFPNGSVDFAKAEADLEYKVISALRNLTRERQGLLAVLQGHGEHEMVPEIRMVTDPTTGERVPQVERVRTEMGELLRELDNAYNVAAVDMRELPAGGLSPSIDVLLIFQPTEAFTEREKYEIDQYIMRGGNVLWVLDQQQVNLDLYENRSTLTNLRELQLDDMFLQYGFKVGYNLVQDLSCESTEVFEEESGQIQSQKWVFYPLLFNLPRHPVTRNVDGVLFRYAGGIDTFSRPGIRHTPFVLSSPYSRTLPGQQFIDLATYLNNPPPQALFNDGNQIMGLMVEGTFTSVFKGRSVPVDSNITQAPTAPFIERSDLAARITEELSQRDSSIADQEIAEYLARTARPRRMAVISDGSFVLGKKFRGRRGRLPYDNKTLILNTIDYLAGDPALTQVRSKEVIERRLSRERVRDNVSLVRILNLVLPLALLALYGLGRAWWRNRKYGASSS